MRFFPCCGIWVVNPLPLKRELRSISWTLLGDCAASPVVGFGLLNPLPLVKESCAVYLSTYFLPPISLVLGCRLPLVMGKLAFGIFTP